MSLLGLLSPDHIEKILVRQHLVVLDRFEGLRSMTPGAFWKWEAEI